VQAKQCCGEGAAKKRGLNKSVAKTTAKKRGLNHAVMREQQNARVKPASGEDDSETEQVKRPVQSAGSQPANAGWLPVSRCRRLTSAKR